MFFDKPPNYLLLPALKRKIIPMLYDEQNNGKQDNKGSILLIWLVLILFVTRECENGESIRKLNAFLYGVSFVWVVAHPLAYVSGFSFFLALLDTFFCCQTLSLLPFSATERLPAASYPAVPCCPSTAGHYQDSWDGSGSLTGSIAASSAPRLVALVFVSHLPAPTAGSG